MHNNERFNFLLHKYLSDNIDIFEREEFFQLLDSGDFDHLINKELEHDLTLGTAGNNADLPPHIAQEIIRNIYNAEKNTTHLLPGRSSNQKWYWMAAASILLIAFSAYFFAMDHGTSNKSQFLSMIPSKTIIQKNTTDEVQTVHLSDGSTVSLYPGATLHYPRKFQESDREVYLEGGAFFQVAKNPAKPFLVYYNDIVTKVLGTSFSVNTNQQTGNVEVSVKTGRVLVSGNNKLLESASLPASVIVTRNQKAVYISDKRLLETALVDEPIPATSGETNAVGRRDHKSFVFDQEKLENIFKQLEDLYGIEIVVENTNLNNCVFTGDINGKDLFTQLKILCLTTNSSYEINGTKILISGKGCP